MIKRIVYLTVFALLVAMTAATAQTIVTGEIAGTVSDPTGAAIANATVLVSNDATGESQTATTGSSGDFRFPLLRPGRYTLTVTAPGFQKTVQHTTVSLGQTARTDIQLGIQTETQVVNVTEQAPLLQNDNANLATTYNTVQLENLPAPGNDMTAYA